MPLDRLRLVVYFCLPCTAAVFDARDEHFFYSWLYMGMHCFCAAFEWGNLSSDHDVWAIMASRNYTWYCHDIISGISACISFLGATLLRSTSFEGQAQSPIARLCLWTVALWFFIMWVDWYCLWIFGVQEGYPIMHPLILLAQQPRLLCLLPIIGKPLLTGLFLLVPAGIVLVLWYQNSRALLFLGGVVIFWLFCLISHDPKKSEPALWRAHIKSLPYMIHSASDDPTVIIKIVSNQIKKLITAYPKTEIIIMPESAFNVSNFAELSELLQLWNEDCLGKPVHIIFGASRREDGNYYNSLHWVYNGVLQRCYDKKHAMLISERLATWMNYDCLKDIYFNARQPIAISCDERQQLFLLHNMSFVPYICSELFFNEWPDDIYDDPIVAIVNDLLFLPYMQKLLTLLARFKAIQWQRDIIYVSYAQSLFIDKWGAIQPMKQ